MYAITYFQFFGLICLIYGQLESEEVEETTTTTTEENVEIELKIEVEDILVSKSCVIDSDCGAVSNCHHALNVGSGIFEGTCACNVNHFRYHGICIPMAKYGDPCDLTSQPCEESNPLLHCVNNTCQCSSSDLLYDKHKRVCVIQAGKLCYEYRSLIHTICVSNSLCRPAFPYRKEIRCVCAEGFTAVNGSCFATYGRSCNNVKTFCNTDVGLVCTNGKCFCHSPLSEIFDMEVHECRRVVGSPCDIDKDCVSGGKCEDNLCACAPGYISTVRGSKKCQLDYGRPCTTNCNEERGFVCKNSVCVCYDPSLIYNNVTGTCTNSMDGLCGEITRRKNIVGTSTTTIGCSNTDNLVCVKLQGYSTCTCKLLEVFTEMKSSQVELCLPI